MHNFSFIESQLSESFGKFVGSNFFELLQLFTID